MRISARNLRIGGATLIAAIFVVGGYLLPGAQFPSTKAVNAELTDELLAAYVSKDTDLDGLPDWQETLYGTNPNVADSDGDGISDGEAVARGLLTPTALASQIPSDPIGEEDIPGKSPAAGSLTEQFSRTFFEAYIQASGGQPMSAEAQQALVQRLLADFSARAARELESSHTLVSVRTNPNLTVSEYVAAVESTLRANDLGGNDADALAFMQQLIEQDDAAAKGKLERIAAAHRAIAGQLLTMSVPPHLADEHLQLLRSFDTLGKSVGSVARYEEDPLGVLGALTVYQPAARALESGLGGIALEILKSGDPSRGKPGYLIVYIARFIPEL